MNHQLFLIVLSFFILTYSWGSDLDGADNTSSYVSLSPLTEPTFDDVSPFVAEARAYDKTLDGAKNTSSAVSLSPLTPSPLDDVNPFASEAAAYHKKLDDDIKPARQRSRPTG